MKTKVALFFGGRSLESDISVITAMQTLAAIDRSLYNVEPVYMHEGKMYVKKLSDIDAFRDFDPARHTQVYLLSGGLYELKRDKLKRYFSPDAALICCHGGEGEGGILQAMLEYNNVKYTSCSPLASELLLDKAASKRMFESLLLNVLPHNEVTKEDFAASAGDVLDSLESLQYPLIVKPAHLGSSIGISAAHDRRQLSEALDVAFRFDREAVVEHMLTNAVEVNCAAYRDGGSVVVSETERPISANDFLTFEDKYMQNGKLSGGGHRIPAGVGATELIVKAVTERLYRELALDGVIRADFLVDENSKVYINEVNTVPGSLAFYLFKDVSHSEFITRLIQNASLKRQPAPKAFKTEVLSRFKGGAKLTSDAIAK